MQENLSKTLQDNVLPSGDNVPPSGDNVPPPELTTFSRQGQRSPVRDNVPRQRQRSPARDNVPPPETTFSRHRQRSPARHNVLPPDTTFSRQTQRSPARHNVPPPDTTFSRQTQRSPARHNVLPPDTTFPRQMTLLSFIWCPYATEAVRNWDDSLQERTITDKQIPVIRSICRGTAFGDEFAKGAGWYPRI